jgi:hypothetical protein
MNKLGWVLAGVLALLVLAAAARLTFGGPLDPPVSVGTPTGKTQINSLPFTIGAPGSYILNSDLTCSSCTSGQDGITIAASQVTLDLNGFQVNGVPGSDSGIIVTGSRGNIEVKNGIVQNWDGARTDGDGGVVLHDPLTGSPAFSSVNTIVENLRVSGNAGYGIVCNVGTVRNNRVHSNSYGILGKSGCDILNNELSANIDYGIRGDAVRNVIDGNRVDGGATGIGASPDTSNVIVRNMVNGATTPYAVTGTTFGPIEAWSTPFSHPWANIHH